MNEKEFEQQIKDELSGDVPRAQLDKAMQAFDNSRARRAKTQKKIFSARNISIFVTSAAAIAAIIIGLVVLLPSGKVDSTINFDQNTPFLTFSTFEQVANEVDGVRLPTDFDEGYDIESLKVFYPSENVPCAVEISYRKSIGEAEYAVIIVTIILADNVLYYQETNYAKCESQETINEISYLYYRLENDSTNTHLAKFRINQIRYYYEAHESSSSTLNSFIISL